MRIMGIDPGSRVTGYGIIEDKPSLRLIACGAIKPPLKKPLPVRLKYIYERLCEEIDSHKPEEIAIEKIFFAENAKSAIVLGQARGVALLSAANFHLSLSEYSPNEVKLSTVGFGKADKAQVGSMVKLLLKLKEIPKSTDISDALAVAICHAHTSGTLKKMISK